MDPNLRLCLRQWLAVVLASLVPVIFTAFIAVPLALGKHPGEADVPTDAAAPERHMSERGWISPDRAVVQVA